jgi:hypothetical protein
MLRGVRQLAAQEEANQHDNLAASLNLYSVYRFLHSGKTGGCAWAAGLD